MILEFGQKIKNKIKIYYANTLNAVSCTQTTFVRILESTTMTQDTVIIRVAEDDPNRCQATNSRGQCVNKAVDGGTVCIVHGGVHQTRAQEANSLKNYRLSKIQWNQQLARLGANPEIKSLRDEIAILRLLMEERLNRCGDSTDLMLQSAAISDLVIKIQTVVASCHKLEGAMGQLLDKQAILNFANEVISIIVSVLSGQEDKISEISNRIMSAIGRVGNEA